MYTHFIDQRGGQKVSQMHLYYKGEECESLYPTIGKTISRFDEMVRGIDDSD